MKAGDLLIGLEGAKVRDVADLATHLHRSRRGELIEIEVYYKLGAAQRLTGDLEGARQSLSRFQELKAASERRERRELEVGTALNEAQSLAAADRLAEALTRIDELLDDHPEEPRAHTLKAKILYSMRRLDEALEVIRAAVEGAPGAVEYHYLEGVFLVELRRPEEAAETDGRSTAEQTGAVVRGAGADRALGLPGAFADPPAVAGERGARTRRGSAPAFSA